MDAHAAHAPVSEVQIEEAKAISKFGMWLFLASEIMFFTGFLGATIVLRMANPGIFHEGASHLNWRLAAFNTVALIASSLTMALAVAAAQRGAPGKLKLFLALTALLGLVFLGVKAIEYRQKFSHGLYPGSSVFFACYFTLTGFHGLHVLAGVMVLLVLLVGAYFEQFGPKRYMPVEATGLYWHFVDLVWIFLFPMLYLLR